MKLFKLSGDIDDVAFYAVEIENKPDYELLRKLRIWCFNNGVSISDNGQIFFFKDEKMRTLFVIRWGNEILV